MVIRVGYNSSTVDCQYFQKLTNSHKQKKIRCGFNGANGAPGLFYVMACQVFMSKVFVNKHLWWYKLQKPTFCTVTLFSYTDGMYIANPNIN